MRVSACLDLLFGESGPNYPERIRAATAAGIDAVELLWWRDADLDEIVRATEETGAVVVTTCAYPFADLPDPASHLEFESIVRESAIAARRLGITKLVLQGGEEQPGIDRDVQRASIVAALKSVAPIAEGEGITLLLEPLNTIDHPGQFVSTSAEGIRIVEETESAAVRLLYDRYHSMKMGEPLGEGIADHVDLISHVHLASVDRAEPDAVGNWPAELSFLTDRGYEGYFGLEYKPSGASAESISYIRSLVDAL
jgi:hydroxypyruvate isomerase